MGKKSDLDVYKVRDHFPILKRKIQENTLVYFDNAATTQKPQSVIDALVEYYTKFNSNIHRGLHTLAEEATVAFEAARDTVKSFIKAEKREEIIFTKGATEGINLISNTWGKKYIKPGDHILISAMEHHANIVPWQILCHEKGAVLDVIPVNEKGELDIIEFNNLLSSKTKILALTQASNVLGTINPVKEMIKSAHNAGAVALIDGAQSSAHMRINVRDTDCDFFVFSSHKLYGPTGVGVLYGKKKILENMPVFLGGGEMISRVSFNGFMPNDLPYKYEAGTPNIADVIAFKAALDFIKSLDEECINRHEKQLLDYATNALNDMPSIKIIGLSENKTSIVSFIAKGIHAQDLGMLLDNQDIAIRTGYHCAEPLVRSYGIDSVARVSFAMYNTKEEIDIFTNALRKAIKMLL